MSKINEVIPNDYPDGIMPDDTLTPLLRMGFVMLSRKQRQKGSLLRAVPTTSKRHILNTLMGDENMFDEGEMYKK